MKILWITANFFPEVGGLQTYAVELIKFLSINHTIGLVGTDQQELPSHLKHRISFFSCAGLSGTRFRFTWDRTRERLHSIIKDFEPDIIHLANAGMTVYWDIIPKYIPVIASVHGNDLTSPWQLTPGCNVNQTILLGLNNCKGVIAVSHYVLQCLQERGIKTPIEVIPNTCDTHVFYPIKIDREKFLRSYGIAFQPPILLTTGRLVVRKGHQEVARALSLIKGPFHWVIVGEGKNRKKIRKTIEKYHLEKRVTMLDWLSQKELVKMYNSCDIYILTPLIIKQGKRIDSEGFGIVYHEANACGKPVIASDEAGCAEAVIDGQTGVLVSPRNTERLRASLQKFFDHSELAWNMGQRGLEYVRSIGGWSSVVKKIEKFYEIFCKKNIN